MSVTLRDVAKAAKVSPATVSKVLNGSTDAIRISDETKQRVLAAAAALDYHPNISARRLASARSHSIGVVIDNYLSFGGPVNARILQGLGEEFDACGYSAVFISRKGVPELEAHLRSVIRSKQVDALLIWTTVPSTLCEFLLAEGVPHCHLADFAPNLAACPAVLSDNRDGGFQATAHLLENGHRSIAIVVEQRFPAGRERLAGYHDALERFGVPFDSRFVVHGAYRDLATHSQIDTRLFLQIMDECTAVFATSDNLALVTRQLITEAGYRVGVDRALVGFDDAPMAAYLVPPLTTVAQDGYRIGQLSARYLLEQLMTDDTDDNQGAPTPRMLVPTRLVIRASSAVVANAQ